MFKNSSKKATYDDLLNSKEIKIKAVLIETNPVLGGEDELIEYREIGKFTTKLK